MSWLDGLRHRVRTLFRADAHTRELTEEMQFHLELDTMHRGDPTAARRAFGSPTRMAESTRDLTWLRVRDLVTQDVRDALRAVRRAPASSLLIVLMLALGIGANAAVFSLADRLYLRMPAGVRAPDELRRLWVRHYRTGDGVPFTSLSFNFPMAAALAPALGGIERTGLYTTDLALHLGREASGERVRGVYASAGYFHALGVQAARGRVYGTEEDRMGQGAPVIVVSDAFWRRQFGADAGAIGQRLTVGAATYTIIGILPPGFTGLDLQAADVWIPLASLPSEAGGEGRWWETQNVYRLNLLYRAAAISNESQLEQVLTARLRQWYRATNRANADTLAAVFSGSLIEARGPARGPAKPRAELSITARLVLVSVFVLLIAWANAGNLLLVRSALRRREVAMRLALGISRGRLARILGLEALFLAGGAGLVAVAVAASAGTLLRRLLMPDIAWDDHPVDLRILLFTLAIVLLSAFVAAIIPGRQAAKASLLPGLLSSTPSTGLARSRLRQALVLVQAALSVTLLVGAVLFVRSLRNITSLDIGYDVTRLVMATPAYERGTAPARATVVAAAREVVARMTEVPGVEQVSRAGMEPMQGFSIHEFYTDRDSVGSFPGREPTASSVSPDFFRTVGLAMLQGAGFSTADVDSAPAEVVVNAAMAQMLWPGESAIGKCLRFETPTAGCYTVAGVVENARQGRVLEADARALYYLPLGRQPGVGQSGRTVIVRVRGDQQGAVTRALRDEMTRAFPGAAISVSSMEERLAPEYRPWRVGATLFTVFGVLALLVAALGVYGTVTHIVQERTREFGVRRALGAHVARIVGDVFRSALPPVLTGVGVGVLLSIAAAPLLGPLLHGVSPRDGVTLGVVSLGVLAVAGVASLVPAWRATRVDPVVVLRAD